MNRSRSRRFPAAAFFLLAALWAGPELRAAAPPPAFPRTGSEEVLALVDGIPITRLQWDRLADPYFKEVEARAGRKLEPEEQVILRKNVLDELIRERLWVADAKRRGFTATEAELDARLQRNDYFKTDGKFDPAKFRQYKFSPESNYREILEQVRNAVLLDKYVAWMQKRYAISEADLRKEFQERTAEAAIRYLWVTPDVISLEPEASAAEIAAHYESHREEFRSSEEARLTYVRIPVEHGPQAPDSVHAAAESKALLSARVVAAALRGGKPADKVAKEFGGLRDTGVFRVGDPIRGLGRTEALNEAIRSAPRKLWIPEPIRVGPYFLVVRVEEHRPPTVRPFREAVPLAKRKADAALREAMIDSLARRDFEARPERYRVPRLTALVLARPLQSFSDPGPVSEKEVARALERLRKSAGVPDTARAWADSLMKTLPDQVRQERLLDRAMRTMSEVAGRLRKGERPEAVAGRYQTVLEPVSLYQGQPPEMPSLLEGGLLDSLYRTSAGTVVGPRLARDSVFVARVTELDARFQPPYERVRAMAHAEVESRRQEENAREAERWFGTRRDRYQTPRRWTVDYVFFARLKPDQAPVPEDSIRAYYERNPLEFTEPARARVRHVLISSRPADAPKTRAAARAKAAGLLKRAKAGESFEALAREHSEDRTTAAKGGDLGEITPSGVVKPFADAAFRLKPGELSPVVETPYGFHVIRMDSLAPQRLRSLEECRQEIRTVLGQEVAEALLQSAAGSFATRAKAGGARFEELAKDHGGVKSGGPVGAREPIQGLGVLPDMEKNLGSLPEGGVTDPLPVEGGLVVARVARAQPPRPAAFEEVKERAIADMLLERRRERADSVAAALERELRAGKSLDTLAIPLGGLRLSRSFPRRGPVPDLARDSILGRDSTLYREIFRSKPGTALKPRRGALGVLFAVVDTVSTLNRSRFAEHRRELKEELFDQRTAAWTDRLRARARIELLWKELRL